MAVKILDCTLRDGGYLNDWNFGKENIKSITKKLVNSNIDLIEICFLDQRVQANINKTIIPDMNLMNDLFGNIDKKNTEFVAMIDYGTFDIDRVLPKSETCIDGIRVIFVKDQIDDMVKFCKKLKEKGYKVYVNAMMIVKYTDEERKELIKKVNTIDIDQITFVDTYGTMYQEDVRHCFELFDKYVNENVAIGFHGHNTIQLALANTINMIKNHGKRDIAVDCSLHGMGKGAGNTPTELLLSYVNKNNITGHMYNLDYIISAIENEVHPMYLEKPWGYSMGRIVSTFNDVYYKYTDFFLKKGLSYKEIVELEKLITEEEKLLYSDKIANKYYEIYKNKKYKYVLFDLDGTILDTTEGILNAIDYTINNCGFKKLSDEHKLTFIGPPIQDSFEKTYGLSKEEAMRVATIFRNRYKDYELYKAKLYKGILELMMDLKKSGSHVGIATYKREDYTLDLVKHFEIDKYCDVIHGSDFAGKMSKADVVSLVLKELNVNNLSDAVMIGDSMNDYVGAIKNALDFIGVTYGFGFKESDEDAKKLKLVNSVSELRNRLM